MVADRLDEDRARLSGPRDAAPAWPSTEWLNAVFTHHDEVYRYLRAAVGETDAATLTTATFVLAGGDPRVRRQATESELRTILITVASRLIRQRWQDEPDDRQATE